jgi:predicted MFS family arabinose efflux permease
VLSFTPPVVVATLMVISLSLGYDMTQPLLAGIVTDLSPKRGLAMGLNVFTLFLGFGLGSLLFSGVLQVVGIGTAYLLFGSTALLAALLAGRLFRSETRPGALPGG